MRAALRVELGKLARQRLPLVSLITLAVFAALMAWGLRQMPIGPGPEALGGGELIVAGKVKTAPLLAWMLLTVPMALHFLIPLLVAAVTGGLVAGERHVGTLRTLLVRPVSRPGVYGAKLVTAWLYAAALTVFLGGFGLVLGYALFGRGDLLPWMPWSSGLVILPHGEALQRLALGYGIGAAGMMAVASLGLCFSCACDNPLTAAGLTVAFLMVSGTLQVIPAFDVWEPYLLTSYLGAGAQVFGGTVSGAEVGEALAWYAAYAGVSTLVGLGIFVRRDVLC